MATFISLVRRTRRVIISSAPRLLLPSFLLPHSRLAMMNMTMTGCSPEFRAFFRGQLGIRL
ncbi:hypothetical protein CASFOL_008934 [Castilleja foliolosa]|uniref:Uncharacterized protein n=1 Tax=Castilleja foliolosa TaxID=1961234 RepID=A0ABD3E4H2_9LAMI